MTATGRRDAEKRTPDSDEPAPRGPRAEGRKRTVGEKATGPFRRPPFRRPPFGRRTDGRLCDWGVPNGTCRMELAEWDRPDRVHHTGRLGGAPLSAITPNFGGWRGSPYTPGWGWGAAIPHLCGLSRLNQTSTGAPNELPRGTSGAPACTPSAQQGSSHRSILTKSSLIKTYPTESCLTESCLTKSRLTKSCLTKSCLTKSRITESRITESRLCRWGKMHGPIGAGASGAPEGGVSAAGAALFLLRARRRRTGDALGGVLRGAKGAIEECPSNGLGAGLWRRERLVRGRTSYVGRCTTKAEARRRAACPRAACAAGRTPSVPAGTNAETDAVSGGSSGDAVSSLLLAFLRVPVTGR